MAKILRLDKKKNKFFCFVLNFSYLCTLKTTKETIWNLINRNS